MNHVFVLAQWVIGTPQPIAVALNEQDALEMYMSLVEEAMYNRFLYRIQMGTDPMLTAKTIWGDTMEVFPDFIRALCLPCVAV